MNVSKGKATANRRCLGAVDFGSIPNVVSLFLVE